MTAPHPIFARILADFGAPVASDAHRGWRISFDFPPVPFREFDWSATHPDYDPTPVYADGPAGDDRIVHGRTREDVIAAIDAWHDEQVDL